MCDPLTIASIALTVGSTIANSAAASRSANARTDVLNAERTRQNALDQEAQALNDRSRNRYKDVEGQREQKAQTLSDYLAPPPEVGAANQAAEMPAPTNSIVTREMNRKSDQASDFVGQQGQALAQLRSFGDLLGDTSRAQARDGSLIGQIGGFKRGSSNITPLELDAANQKGAGLRTLGDIMGGLGSIGLSAGLTGGGGSLASMFGGGQPLTAMGAAAAPTAAGSVLPRSTATLAPKFSGIY